MSVRHRFVAWFTASYFAALAVLPSSLSAGDFIKSVFKGPSVTTKEPCVERLAQEIDWLERHIDQYGSVVAKQPDVWGQARLTKHRDELEKQLFAQLNQFHVYLNGTLNRADQAFLANAFSLSASLNGAPPPTPVQSTTMTGTPSQTIIQKFEAGHFATHADGDIGLEPVVALDQLNRYINHLHELRRINEGDDTADSPGYSLNLVRIPVSVLPGRATNEGYGAEITITATPYLNDGLLPVTFRNLVINDLVDQLGLPLTKIADNELWKADEAKRIELEVRQQELCQALSEYRIALQEESKRREAYASIAKSANLGTEYISGSLSQALDSASIKTLAPDIDDEKINQLNTALSQTRTAQENIKAAQNSFASKNANVQRLQAQVADLQSKIAVVVGPTSRTRNAQNPIPPSAIVSVFGEEELLVVAKTFGEGYQGRDVRWNDEPKKIVHLPDLQRFVQSELQTAYQCLARPEYLAIWDSLPQGFGQAIGDGGIVTAIRRGDRCEMKAIRDAFLRDFRAVGNALKPTGIPCDGCNNPSCLEALAWAILVESALLDAHLKGDMTSVAQLRGCGCGENCHLRFFMPDPGVEERQAFQEYVRCRWPIHVFALDPVTQDQNIGDAATIRREMQLAVSLAFVGGKMSASNFTKFTRQFEAQFETIALNRTLVGFSHGDDTFGWRFYPRFQTPPTKGNIAAFHETLWGKHKDCDLLNRKIEPGMRECVAVVIMPSFVPYVTFDVRSNWFRLNHHHGLLPSRDQAEPSMTDTMKLSRAVQQMHHTAACIRDANSYRGADVALLMNRVHQLDRELPLQTMTAQVPIENTLGGFEMFSNGVTDLAPDLYGWYGGPGVFEEVDVAVTPCATTAPPSVNGIGGTQVQPVTNVCPCGIKGTTLFLVGDHFSVHDTKVIAGDQCISDVSLLSRQIMRVTLPEKLKPNKLDGIEYIDVHVATPYGVTSHLHIPYIRKPKAAAATPSTWSWFGATKFGACVCFDGCGRTLACDNSIDLGRVFGFFSAGDRFPVKSPTANVTQLTFTATDKDGNAVGTAKTERLQRPFVLTLNSSEQAIFEAAQVASYNTAVVQLLEAYLTGKSTTTTVTIGTTIEFAGERFSSDNVLTVAIRPTDSCEKCAPSAAEQLPAPPPAPAPANRASHMRHSVLEENSPFENASMQLPAGPVPFVTEEQLQQLRDEGLAISQNVATAVAPPQASAPTATSAQVPAAAVSQVIGLPILAPPQTPGAVTTIMQGVPVTGQPVPVPVLVPALPAQSQPVTPAPQRHPCPCKSLRFAVPGCETSEAFPGDDLSEAPPLRNLRRMLGWQPSHGGGEPRFLDPQFLPATYMQPLPMVHSN